MTVHLLESGSYVVRHSAGAFTIGNGKTTTVEGETLPEDTFTQRNVGDVELPEDWHPWRYYYQAPNWVKSPDHPDNVPAPVVNGRAINRMEFLDCAMETDPIVFNTILKEMPVVSQYLEDFKAGGIQYTDAVLTADKPGYPTRIQKLFGAAILMGLLTPEIQAAFLAKWVELYPETLHSF